jgi:YD repeat-containing protein
MVNSQIIEDADSPSRAQVMFRPIILEVNGEDISAEKDLEDWQLDWREYAQYGDSIFMPKYYHNSVWLYTTTKNWYPYAPEGEDISVPTNLTIQYLPFSLNWYSTKYQSVILVAEGYDVYTRPIPTISGSSILQFEGDWKRGQVFSGDDTTNCLHEAIIRPKNEKGALGGKVGQLHSGTNQMMISLGFLANGDSAGYITLIDDRNPVVQHDPSFFKDCYYFPFTSVKLSSVTADVSAEYEIKTTVTSANALALKTVVSPQVTVDIVYTDWGGDRDSVYYNADAVESITVKNNTNDMEIVTYYFFYFKEFHPIRDTRFEYIVIKRDEGEDTRYALILHQDWSASTWTQRIETPFVKPPEQGFVSPPLVTSIPTDTTYENFFKQFVTQYESNDIYLILEEDIFGDFRPHSNSYAQANGFPVKIFDNDFPGSHWESPEYLDNNESYSNGGGDYSVSFVARTYTQYANTVTGSIEESYFDRGAYLSSRIFSEINITDGTMAWAGNADRVLSYTVHRYSGYGHLNNVFQPDSSKFGFSRILTDNFRVGRPGYHTRTVRGADNLETAFRTTASYQLHPGSYGNYRKLAVDFYTMAELAEDEEFWEDDSPLDPFAMFETPLQTIEEFVLAGDLETPGTNYPVGLTEFDIPVRTSSSGLYGQPLVIRVRNDHRNADNSLTTTTASFHPHADITWLRDLPYYTIFPDDTKKVFLYETGTLDSTGQSFTPGTGANDKDLRITTLSGLNAGGTAVTTWNSVSGGHESIVLVQNKSMIDTTLRSRHGFTTRMESRAYNNVGQKSTSGQAVLHWQKMQYDRAGHLIRREDDKGQVYQAEYSSGGTRYTNDEDYRRGQKIWELLEDGTEYHYAYDRFGRVLSRTRLAKDGGAYGSLGHVATVYEYDADNRITREATGAVDPQAGFTPTSADSKVEYEDLLDPLVTVFKYNAMGEVYERTENGYTTDIELPELVIVEGTGDDTGKFKVDVAASHGLVTTETLPTGATRVTTRYDDGSIASISGTADVPTYYEYGLENDNGTYYESVTVFHGADGRAVSLPLITLGNAHKSGNYRYTKVVKDWLGNEIRKVHSSGADNSDDESRTKFTYNANGQLDWKQTDSLAKHMFTYDAFGQLELACIDVTGNSQLDLNSTDRINKTTTAVELYSGQRYRVTRHYTYVDGSGTPKLVSTERVRLSGLGTSGTYGKLVASTSVEDANGQITSTNTWVDRTTGITTQLVSSPFYTESSLSFYLLGKLVKTISPSGVTTTYSYDAWDRLVEVEDAKFGVTQYTYYATTHKLHKIRRPDITNPANIIDDRVFEYDAGGRLIKETNATSKTTRYAYNDRNQLTHIWGDVPYPVKHTYYESGPRTGQLMEKITYQANASGGWNQSPETLDTWWPSSGGNATTYDYYLRSGLLKSVTYPTVSGETPSITRTTIYTYTLDGRLLSRSWTRKFEDDPITATYAYDEDTGELAGVSYNDDEETAPIAYTYNRRGALTHVQDATGHRYFYYNSTDFQLQTELLPQNYYGTADETWLAYSYDPQRRFNGFELRKNVDDVEISELQYLYDYDPANGRLNKLSTPAGMFAYGYLANTNFYNSITHEQSDWQREVTYRSKHPVIDTIQTKYGAPAIASYGYNYDKLLRRTRVNMGGKIFERYGDDLVQFLSYNNRNELLYTTTYYEADEEQEDPIQDRYHGYSYDHIGNRSSVMLGSGSWATYDRNSLNQYTKRADQGYFFARGFAQSTATVTYPSATGLTCYRPN